MADRHPQDFDPDRPDLAFAGGPRHLRHDPLIRLLAINWLIGAAVAGAVTAVVLITDTAHLRSLMLASNEPWIPMLLLFFGFLITMCSVTMATAVMMLPGRDDDDDGGSGGGPPVAIFDLSALRPKMQPVPIRVEAPRHPVRHPRRH